MQNKSHDANQFFAINSQSLELLQPIQPLDGVNYEFVSRTLFVHRYLEIIYERYWFQTIFRVCAADRLRRNRPNRVTFSKYVPLTAFARFDRSIDVLKVCADDRLLMRINGIEWRWMRLSPYLTSGAPAQESLRLNFCQIGRNSLYLYCAEMNFCQIGRNSNPWDMPRPASTSRIHSWCKGNYEQHHHL